MKRILLFLFLLLNTDLARAQWVNVAQWSYDFGTITNSYTNTPGTNKSSTSTASTAGFLPVTSGGNTGVYISGSAANGAFTLNNNHTITEQLPTSNMVRYSANDIPSATDVVLNSFTIKFSSSISTADAGSYMYAIGHNNGNLFNPVSNNSVNRASNELFTVLRWAPVTTAGSTGITFAYRLGADSLTITTYTTIDATTFAKGGTYNVEVYCNNSTSATAKTYTRGGVSYNLPQNTFHIWVNGTKIGSDYPRSIEVNGNSGLSGGTSKAMPNGTTLNSFLFSATGGAGATGNITLSYPVLSYLTTDTFDSAAPSKWSVSGASSLVLSNEHVKGGRNAWKWTTNAGGKLSASALGISAADIWYYSANSAKIHIYSKAISADTLVFQFLDAAGNVQREGHMLLNYKGWRDYHRSYRYDYNYGLQSASSFALDKVNIIYRPAGGTGQAVIYVDEVQFSLNAETRTPGPHMRLDYQHFQRTADVSGALESWLNTPDMAATTPSSQELAGITQVKTFYNRTLSTVTAAALLAAKTYVANCGITRNADNSIKGRGISATSNVDTLVLLSTHCGALASAYGLNGDTDALSKLRLLVEHLIDQGVSEGGDNIIAYSDYTSARAFPVGFLQALPYLDSTTKSDVMKMLKWSNEYNRIYQTTFTPGLSTDYTHVKSNFVTELALLGNSNAEITRDLKSVSRYLEQFTYPGQGARDGIKPDGSGFHHNSQHISYMYAFSTWIIRAYEFKGTPFKISNTAYQNMSFAIRNLFLETSKGTLIPNSASGRAPFQSSISVAALNVRQLVEVGGDLTGQAYEPQLAAFYNYIFKTNTYAVTTPNLDGFYQLNYSQTGIQRKNNWVAVMRGLTDRMFGSEIYTGANRYGRYQSYGALEVLYDGNLTSTGYISAGAGWDWNMMPGTTSVKQSWTLLQPLISGTASEYQGDAFAGALSMGNNGIFGMNFTQNPGTRYATSGLNFRKSVFTFDSVMVCLGSGIIASNTTDPVITTLFQSVSTATDPAIYINSATAQSAATDQTLSTTSSSQWLVNGQTTGFYIPQGNGSIRVFRGTQTTPINSVDNATTTATANVSKSWFEHGTQPSGAKYQFVVVPAVTPAKMQALATSFSSGSYYSILKQTDSVHAVLYIPQQLTSYVCFLPKTDINTGYLQSISNRALVGIRESADSLFISVANPDLKAVDNAASTWVSTASTISLGITGLWHAVDNATGAGITLNTNSSTVSFTVHDGFPATLTLVKNEIIPGAMLPLSAQSKAKDAVLSWGVTANSSTNKFTVMRSTDGKNYNEIASVNANSGSSYQYTDSRVLSDATQVYYYIRAANKDGATSDGNVATVKLSLNNASSTSTSNPVKSGATFNISPNPTNSKATISLNAKKTESAYVKVINAKGEIVWQATKMLSEGLNTIEVDLSGRPPGTYVVYLSRSGVQGLGKIIKL
ncbi:polysaccharide lyase family 8 super-sandwich domain-containing protein [Mucilaginibacter gracilis]|nr:polysaccharide lyase family 8 super-sandwich domain-containing protein [Mucilaginibacter gracilis]